MDRLYQASRHICSAGDRNPNPTPTYFAGMDEDRIIVDATNTGNVSKYINHSCEVS
jgi:hypothetical protein